MQKSPKLVTTTSTPEIQTERKKCVDTFDAGWAAFRRLNCRGPEIQDKAEEVESGSIRAFGDGRSKN
jgi:hypothetical protein